MMELNYLRQFYEVARTGGVTAAARRLRVQQPAVSKALRKLEDQMGSKLTQRAGRRLALTPLGERVFQVCERVFDEVDAIPSLIGEGGSTCSGPIAFGVSDSIAVKIVPSVL